MSGSCHLDRASNVKIGVIFFNCGRVLQFGAHSRYYKGSLTQKRWFLVICTTFRSDFQVSWKNQNKHSTLISSFDALSKWHEPDINWQNFFKENKIKCIKMKWNSRQQFLWTSLIRILKADHKFPILIFFKLNSFFSSLFICMVLFVQTNWLVNKFSWKLENLKNHEIWKVQAH